MALPLDFITRTKTLLGEKEYNLLETALQTESPVSIRLNLKKATNILSAELEPVPWSKWGYYLPERLSFTFDPLFHAGVYYVQEASSMFLEQAIQEYVKQPVRCLDLCAAPGGKSTHLSSLLPEGSLLVSNEVIRNRSNILAENISKWGNPATIVTNNDPEEIGKLTHFFDVIVTDVPCSGEGMFRKDTDSTGEWSTANVQLCASRQRRIIHDIWEALAPGGLLIYSTCTYNTEEDEENIEYIARELGAEVLSLPVIPEWNITGALKGSHQVYRFFPHRTRGEGFFLAILRKKEGTRTEIKYRKKEKKEKGFSLPVPPIVKQWVRQTDQYQLEMRGENIRAIPKTIYSDYYLLSGYLHILSAGIHLGEVKGKNVVPSQALALSVALNTEAFTCEEISWEEAILYLKKEAVSLPESLPKGYVLLTYKHIPLGFVKHLGNRSNNLYPSEWRIRSSHWPENPRFL